MIGPRERRENFDRHYPPAWHRILSGVCALAWLGLEAGLGGAGPFLRSFIPIAAAVGCIWFADELASWEVTTGMITNRVLKAGPPAGLIRAFGWLALVAWTFGRALIFWALAPRPS